MILLRRNVISWLYSQKLIPLNFQGSIVLIILIQLNVAKIINIQKNPIIKARYKIIKNYRMLN